MKLSFMAPEEDNTGTPGELWPHEVQTCANHQWVLGWWGSPDPAVRQCESQLKTPEVSSLNRSQ